MITLNNLNSQSEVVVEQLMRNNSMTRDQAIRCWNTSKTKETLEREKLFYVSGMRCYVELTFELTNNTEKWMSDPFDM